MALGHHGSSSGQNAKSKSNGDKVNSAAAAAATGRLTKKTNSTDNLIDYTTTSSANTSTNAPDQHCTDAMVREVQLALRYFEDAVTKGTYELLPGCATVVLETVLSMQSYALSRTTSGHTSTSSLSASITTAAPKKDDKRKGKLTTREELEMTPHERIVASTKNVCATVAKLTQWADRVIIDGCVDPSEDYVGVVIDPVRNAVIVLANHLLAISTTVPRATSFHNSLPDLASPDEPRPGPGREAPSLPSRLQKGASAPPLPPKQHVTSKPTGSSSYSQSDDSVDCHHQNVDWFSNPLFDNGAGLLRPGRPKTRGKRKNSRTGSDSSGGSKPSEFLDTTLPDFCQPQRMSICEQTVVSYIDVSPNNLARDSSSVNAAQDYHHFDAGTTSDPLHLPLATSSPRISDCRGRTSISGGVDYPDNTSSSTSSDIPPALPRKMTSHHHHQHHGGAPPVPQRKVSTYDNVFLPGQEYPRVTAFPTFQGHHRESDGRMTTPSVPPPLPPKKKHIMSYMEMFGRSVFPTGEDLLHSLTQTQDLLEAVWQQNYHDFSYLPPPPPSLQPSAHPFSHSHSVNYRHNPQSKHSKAYQLRPTKSSYYMASHCQTEAAPPLIPLIGPTCSGMPPPFPNVADDEDPGHGDREDEEDEDEGFSRRPPALPPKRGQRPVASQLSGGERTIPIVRESDGSVVVCNRQPPQRQESSSSAVSTSGAANISEAGGGGLHHHHRLSAVSGDSMASSTSSSGLGTDVHSQRQSLPSSVCGASQTPSIPPTPTPVLMTTGSSSSTTVPETTVIGSKTPSPPPPSSQTSLNARKQSKKETSPSSAKAKARRSSSKKKKSTSTNASSVPVLDQMDVRKSCSELLMYTHPANSGNDDGTNTKELLRGGTVDALIVLATQSIKNDFLYQEAFLATYRTFISTHDLLEKLVQRFRKFNHRRDERPQQQMTYKRAAHSSFSLMVRVVDGLADCDFQESLVMELLTDFMSELVSDGELVLARALRSKFIEKYEDRRSRLLPDLDTSGLSQSSKQMSLLNFKSVEIAEQMTLLDAQLFLRLDSAELILWVQEQNEDKSPNLTKFTEHFNNMSYWCRTVILQQEEAKERERLVLKFIKIMKWLRKHNNFNSYLALLSALDSAPVRRLEWQKSITEGLKEHCALIDSSSSFRAYRQALSVSTSPCIPYVGLVLQDLTFVHIGNSDSFDGKVNFAKRWQQFNILDNLRRFKKETYHFERREDIIQFFGEFEHYWSEDQMWAISESIKPRGQKQTVK